MSTQPRKLPALLTVAVLALTAAACGTETVEGDEIETKVSDSLERQVGQRPDEVRCPDEVEASRGTKARCTLVGSDGSEIGVAVTMTDDQGAFDYEVDNTVAKPPSER